MIFLQLSDTKILVPKRRLAARGIILKTELLNLRYLKHMITTV